MQDELKLIRHSIRGTINALKLGAQVLDERLPHEEAIEFLDYVIQAAERMDTLLDQYEAYPSSRSSGSKPVTTMGT